VFSLLAECRRVDEDEVAEMLKMSQKTVANDYTLIRQKRSANSPVEMIRLTKKHGLIDTT